MSRQGTTPPGRAPQWRRPSESDPRQPDPRLDPRQVDPRLTDPRLADPRQQRPAPPNPYPNLPPFAAQPPPPPPPSYDAYGQPAPDAQYHYPQHGQAPAQQSFAPPRQGGYPPQQHEPSFGTPPPPDQYQQQLARLAQDTLRAADYPPEPSLPGQSRGGYRTSPPPPPPPGALPHGNADPRFDLRGSQFDAGWPHQSQRAADAQGYDLGSYGAAPSSAGYPPAGGAGATMPGYAESWDEPQPPPLSPRDARGNAVQALPDDEYDDEEDYEDEPSGGGWRPWLVMVALLVSIGAGGAMAFVYKKYMSGSSSPSTSSVVRASKEPQKIAPDDAGGRQFAGADSRYMGRLETDNAQGDVDSNGVRRVQTLQVGRDGSLGAPVAVPPPAPPPASQAANSNSSLTIPGAIIEGFGRPSAPRSPPQAVAEPPAAPQPAPTRVAMKPPAPPSRPQVLSRTDAVDVPAAQPVQTASAASRPKAGQPVAKAAPAASSGSGASGYVCVLASTGSRMEALKKFADLQQKFDALKDHVPEVKEVDLSARGLGTMYRLVAGPPSSKEAASGLCGTLRSGGLAGDPWVTTY